MKIYLVGGAVRDSLLGLPISERDWVVVGASPEQLLALGYRSVGHDFPVFLHPETQEEYALARTEKKQGHGYYGFSCDAGPEISLEEDLSRRDLTINAMAMDADGQLIDPYGGHHDLKNRVFRHVSNAFMDDPVRVLRLARFSARFHYLGFKLARETRHLIQQMLRNGELAHLVPERVWQEWQGSLQALNPEQFIYTLRDCGALRVVLPEIDDLFGIPNAPEHCPQIDTGIQSLQRLADFSKRCNDPITRFSSLLYQCGKAQTPMAAWPQHLGFEAFSQTIILSLCARLRIPKRYLQAALLIARWHSLMGSLPLLQAERILDFFEQSGCFRDPQPLVRLIQVYEAFPDDKANPCEFSQNWRILLDECLAINARIWAEQGLGGPAIKTALYQARVQKINDLRQLWEFNELN